MNIDKYLTFLACAEAGTFYEAADALYTTPATVSKHITSLEKEMNVTLFKRTAKGIILTREGRRRLPIIRRIVEANNVLMEMKEESDEAYSILEIPTIPNPARFKLKKVLTDFEEEYPGIQCKISEYQKLQRQIEIGRFEMGFIGSAHIPPEDYDSLTFIMGRMGVIVSDRNPLSGRKSISLRELWNEDFVEMGTSGLISTHRDFCRQCGFEPHIVSQTSREDAEFFYVKEYDCVALFSSEIYELYNAREVTFIPLEENFLSTGALIKLKKTTLSPSAEKFWFFFSDYIQAQKISCQPYENMPDSVYTPGSGLPSQKDRR